MHPTFIRFLKYFWVRFFIRFFLVFLGTISRTCRKCATDFHFFIPMCCKVPVASLFLNTICQASTILRLSTDFGMKKMFHKGKILLIPQGSRFHKRNILLIPKSVLMLNIHLHKFLSIECSALDRCFQYRQGHRQ